MSVDRIGWALSYLKKLEAVENSRRGVWVITPAGRSIDSEAELDERLKAYFAEVKHHVQPKGVEDESDGEDEEEVGWKRQLLARLLALSPDAFERLTQRLLREAGFRDVEVLGKSGDGGLDGVGVYKLSLVSFPVYFQCKRFKGSVQAGSVRDFRGAMAGRGEKGLLVTTGTFTSGVRRESNRDGAPPVELIEGEDLCDLLKEYELGVTTTTRTVEVVTVEGRFFDQF